VDGAGVERVRGVADAEEAGGLLEGFRAKARDGFQLGAGFEGAVFVTVGDDGGGSRGVEAGDVAEELFRGRVEFDANAVHRADDGVVEGTFEGGLVDVVLVLADTDGFRDRA